jgi:hypothetical protein
MTWLAWFGGVPLAAPFASSRPARNPRCGAAIGRISPMTDPVLPLLLNARPTLPSPSTSPSSLTNLPTPGGWS